MPFLSVIVPVYNVEAYLKECLDSVIFQTFKDIEILCVDDGSTDGCPEILRQYAEHDSRIRIISKTNGGLSSARNTGIDHARGKYLYFLDSDDLITENSLEIISSCLSREPVDILEFCRKVFYEPGLPLDPFEEKSFRNGTYPEILTGEEMFVRLSRNRDYTCMVPTRVWSAEFFRQNHFRFHEGVIHEDEAFTLCSTLAAKRYRRIPDICYSRRVRANSIMTGSKAAKSIAGCLTAHEDISVFLQDRTTRGLPGLSQDAMDYVFRCQASLLLSVRTRLDVLSPKEKKELMTSFGYNLESRIKEAETYLQRAEAEDERKARGLAGKLLSPFRCIYENGPFYTLKKVLQRFRRK